MEKNRQGGEKEVSEKRRVRPLATKGRLQPREEPLRAPSSIFPSDQEGDSKEIEELETSEIVKTCMLALLECLSLPRYSLLSRYFLVSFDDDDVRCTGRLHTHRTLLFMPVSTYVRSSQHVRAERVIYRVSQSNSATLKFSLFLSLSFSSGCFVPVRMEVRVSRQIDLPPGNGRSSLPANTHVLRSCFEDRSYFYVHHIVFSFSFLW